MEGTHCGRSGNKEIKATEGVALEKKGFISNVLQFVERNGVVAVPRIRKAGQEYSERDVPFHCFLLGIIYQPAG